jgi:hypothetical protein
MLLNDLELEIGLGPLSRSCISHQALSLERHASWPQLISLECLPQGQSLTTSTALSMLGHKLSFQHARVLKHWLYYNGTHDYGCH